MEDVLAYAITHFQLFVKTNLLTIVYVEVKDEYNTNTSFEISSPAHINFQTFLQFSAMGWRGVLGFEYGIVQAPLGPDISGPELVAAVANAGALALLRAPDWVSFFTLFYFFPITMYFNFLVLPFS